MSGLWRRLLGKLPGSAPSSQAAPAAASGIEPTLVPARADSAAEPESSLPWAPAVSQALKSGRSDIARSLLEQVGDSERGLKWWELLGHVHAQSAEWDEVQAALDGALSISDDSAQTHFVFGALLLEHKHFGLAEDLLSVCVALQPSHPRAWIMLGDLHARRDELVQAIAAYRQAIPGADDELRATALFQLARAAHVAKQYDVAREAYAQGLALRPDDVVAWVFYGHLELLQENDLEALACYETATRLSTSTPAITLLLHHGMALQYAGRWEAARDKFDQVMAISPNDSLARWYRCQCDLALGDWARGWPHYVARYAAKASSYRPLPYPVWKGERDAASTLLVLADQGLGDEIMFASCVSEAAQRVGKVIFECEPRLHRLFTRSFPDVQVVTSLREMDASWITDRQNIDFQIASGDLPSIFRLHESTFPRHKGYLAADPAAVDAWRHRLQSDAPDALRVGISWRGGIEGTRTRTRSTGPEDWRPILHTPGLRFVNLQYGNYQDELAAMQHVSPTSILDYPEIAADYDDTAALVAALDLVVTVCTSIVHLTGALGRDVWVLTPFSPGWRYTARAERMPWYPTARLFRQQAAGAWTQVCETVALNLSDWAAEA